MNRCHQAWMNATRPIALDGKNDAREQIVRGTLVIQLLSLLVIAPALLAGAAAGLTPLRLAVIALVLMLGALAGLWFANLGWLEAASFTPVALFFMVGAYGSWEIGWVATSTLFYALSLTMAAITFQGRGLWMVVLAMIGGYFSINLIYHPTAAKEAIVAGISFTAAMSGMAILLGLQLSELSGAIEQSHKFAGEARQYRSELAESEQRLRSLVGKGGIASVTGVAVDITHRIQRDAEMTAIVTVAQAMRTANSRAEMFPIILKQTTELLHSDGALIVMEDREKHGLIVELGTGSWVQSTGIHMPQPNSISHMVYSTAKPYLNNDIHSEDRVAYPKMFTGLTSVAGVPLIAGQKTVGILWVGCTHSIDDNQMRILTAIGEMAANTIHRATLFEDVERTKYDLELAYNNTLQGWASALELRDMETKGHSQRVTDTTLLLAVLMGCDDEELSHIQRGALMHDIGKMGIPDNILLKPGPLTPDEWNIMTQHPQYAYDMLKPILFLRPALDIPYSHHEKWDGSGYPRGLKGEDIPLMARIFAVVDVWDALLSDRPYRNAWSQEKTTAYIQAQSGLQFDPEVVPIFLQMVASGFVEIE